MAVNGGQRDPQAIGRLRQDLDGALDVMRDNMRTMAERDAQLHDLDSKSNTLHAANRLRKEQQWQRMKTKLIMASVVLGVVWCVVLYFWKGQKIVFAGVSAAVVLVLAPFGWCLIRRWRGDEQSDPLRSGVELSQDGDGPLD
eukprot:TRINITY_DN36148_c0_g1_i1.p1 TRINITY_DN36148_c0_g1~~TRINITY_DN36148_c0_g1_i1.p1  ORF type:complete len:152 (+),score=32.60 TRINITY_DN36148_c0_g1_i1:31-456(+)